MTPPVRDQATGKVLKHARPLRKSKQQAHSYQRASTREAVADARAQIRYHEAQIAGLREGVQLRRELAGPKPKRAATPKASAPKAPPSREQQIAAAGGYVPKTPADKLRKTAVRELTDAQLLRDWENHPPERRRGVLEREMARRQAKAAKASAAPAPKAKPPAKPRAKRATMPAAMAQPATKVEKYRPPTKAAQKIESAQREIDDINRRVTPMYNRYRSLNSFFSPEREEKERLQNEINNMLQRRNDLERLVRRAEQRRT